MSRSGGSPRSPRLYVALRCGPACDGQSVVPLGTVTADSRAAARAVAHAVWGAPRAAAQRPGARRATRVVRVVRAGACRLAWLIAALSRDGAERGRRRGRAGGDGAV